PLTLLVLKVSTLFTFELVNSGWLSTILTLSPSTSRNVTVVGSTRVAGTRRDSSSSRRRWKRWTGEGFLADIGDSFLLGPGLGVQMVLASSRSRNVSFSERVNTLAWPAA